MPAPLPLPAPADPAFDPLQLLRVWCDGLLAHQVADGPEAGGIFCPSHQCAHGRCGDAVYPLLSLFSRTGEERYRTAARAVYAWSERLVSQADGSWTNEADGKNDWKGISCFSVISLGETLRLHGETLTADERAAWRERVRRGADFLLDFITLQTGDINYTFSTALALALAASHLDEGRYLSRAKELAAHSLGHFTANNLIWGEGERGPDDVSPRGLRPIDLLYNFEESIPNLAMYAELTGDDAAHRALVVSLQAHLEWMLPDGGWDAGWCTRLAKWTYWGSRTSDGCTHGFALLQKDDPRFAEAALRNLRLMASATHDGLLHGGPHLRSRGLPICSHPTFAHARGLAIALDAGLSGSVGSVALPADHATGVRAWPEAGVTQIALGPWRASITVNDIPETRKRGGRPSGGALSMVWHARTGPLCVASMNVYHSYEGINMDEAASAADRFVLTPRIEVTAGERVYSNLYDGEAQLTSRSTEGSIEATAVGTLRNSDGVALPGNAAFALRYTFSLADCTFDARTDAADAVLIVPIVSRADEPFDAHGDREFHWHKPDALVRLTTSHAPSPPPDSVRVFNYVPGLQAVPVALAFGAEKHVSARIIVDP